jgi:predicted nucleic acid-binding protein
LVEALGFARITSAEDAELRRLFAQFNEVPVDAYVIAEAIRLRRIARMKSPDALVAASALLRGAHLITRNVDDFKNIPGLTVLHPANA